jgi:hypothetical protein
VTRRKQKRCELETEYLPSYNAKCIFHLSVRLNGMALVPFAFPQNSVFYKPFQVQVLIYLIGSSFEVNDSKTKRYGYLHCTEESWPENESILFWSTVSLPRSVKQGSPKYDPLVECEPLSHLIRSASLKQVSNIFIHMFLINIVISLKVESNCHFLTPCLNCMTHRQVLQAPHSYHLGDEQYVRQ